MDVQQRSLAPKKKKKLSDEKMKPSPNDPHVVILGLEASPKKPTVEVSKKANPKGSLMSFPTFPHRQRSQRRTKPKIMKSSEFLKPQCRRKRKCKEKDEDEDEDTIEHEIVRPSSGRERLRKKISNGNEIDPQRRKLDTCTFQCYFENLWKRLPDEKRNSFTYLDCLWFNLYLKPNHQTNVLKWIKKKEIFSKKYVIVPIVRWDHWSLLIFCHMGESLQSETSTPCMLLLDSLGKANPKRLEPEIRKFVLDLYKTEERPETKKQIYRIPLKIPKVPQQKNGEDCGKFVLYYINLFIEGAPESFSISEGYPYFMKKDWFTQDSLGDFLRRLGERDNIMDALQFQENCLNENLEKRGTRRNQVHITDQYLLSEIVSESLEYHPEKRVTENKNGSSEKAKKSHEDLNIHILSEDDSQDNTDLINFDKYDVPPVCSCTGFPRQCSKSGNGGWQSSCCSITLSGDSLPVLPNKRNSRIVGRKMSGNVFKRLLTRLVEEGHGLSVPVDLKNYWAKHGTNRHNSVK